MTTGPFAFSMEEAKRQNELAQITRDRSKKDPRICKCGHGAKAHTSESDSEAHAALRASGRFACNPARLRCPCKKFEPVMTTGDVRKFIAKTEGPAELHALARGVLSCWEKGIAVEWIPGTLCDGCQGQGLLLYPIAIGPGGTESYKPTAINVLLCATCRGKLTHKDD